MLSRKMKLFAAILFSAVTIIGVVTVGNAQDYKAAVDRAAADQGNADAQLELGIDYELGKGVEKDTVEAVKWWCKAAEQGNVKAQLKLGSSYLEGYGVKEDQEEGVKWFRKAAEQGDAMAQQALGNFYHLGHGVKQDDKEAAEWWQKSAAQGNGVARNKLIELAEIEKDIQISSKQQTPYDIGGEVIGDIHHAVIQGGNNKHEEDPILVKFKICLNKDSSTVGLNDCLGAAYDSYDKIINQIYQQALAKNDDATKKYLQLSQRKWLSFRDAEAAAQGSYAATDRGTIIGIAIGYQRLTAIRERISELMFYLGADQG